MDGIHKYGVVPLMMTVSDVSDRGRESKKKGRGCLGLGTAGTGAGGEPQDSLSRSFFSPFFLLFFSSSSPPNKLDVQLLQQSELQETYRNTIVGNQDFGDDRGASKALHKNGTSSCGTRAKDRAGLGCGTAPKVREADVSYASTSDSG